MWRNMGSPDRFNLVEAGPGRGTLMADLLRSAAVDVKFVEQVNVQLIEISQPLRQVQKAALADYSDQIGWCDNIQEITSGPVIIIGNEFLDALPFRQYIKVGENWHERVVAPVDGGIGFDIGPGMLAPDALPKDHQSQVEGTIFENSSARESFTGFVAQHIKDNGGAALMIDYGHLKPGYGDTFQAVKSHQYCDPLFAPGEADLTSHVDFSALCKSIENIADLNIATTSQSQFLLELGLLERAGALGQGKSALEQKNIEEAVERLAAGDQMGELFKVMGIANDGVELVGFSNGIGV